MSNLAANYLLADWNIAIYPVSFIGSSCPCDVADFFIVCIINLDSTERESVIGGDIMYFHCNR